MSNAGSLKHFYCSCMMSLLKAQQGKMPDDFSITRSKFDELCVQLFGVDQITCLMELNALLE
jgi:hypothetical protein